MNNLAGSRPVSGTTLPVGIVLAAGDGTRLGTPKGTLTRPDGTTWASHASQVLLDGGCRQVYVVVGAAADAVAASLPRSVTAVQAREWREGLSESLRAGLEAALGTAPGLTTVVIVPVDTPSLSAAVVRRVLAAAGSSPDALARSVFRGSPGHPVVIGANHLTSLMDGLGGDSGANTYLRTRSVLLIECSDLATGEDVDTPAALERASFTNSSTKSSEENRS